VHDTASSLVGILLTELSPLHAIPPIWLSCRLESCLIALQKIVGLSKICALP
jgi:hypothetical protein